MHVSRRQFVVSSAAVAGATLLEGPSALARERHRLKLPELAARDSAFDCGVASGAPGVRDAVLWTRLDGLERAARLRYEVSTDPGFRKVVDRGTALAAEGRDFTVHEHVRGLRPGEEYWYRFEHRGGSSPVGRFRTRPPRDSREPVKLGFCSCQDYGAGYFTALAGLAHEDVDMIVFLGDYIYEHTFYPGPAARRDRTGKNRDGDVQTLAEYRAKYRLYRSDPHLQRVHAKFAFVPLWDDHEVEDNYAAGRPDSKSKDPTRLENDNLYPRRVPFARRRRAGYRAFADYMPRRSARLTPGELYGAIPLGAHATLFLTDQRRHRSPQPCRDQGGTPCPEAADPARTMLGARQKAWFKRALREDRATWKLWANELMMMPLDFPTRGVAVNLDQWDGYAAERRELLAYAVRHKVENLVLLTGDIHNFYAGELRANGKPAAVEFVGGSITSLGLDGLFPAPALPGFVKTLRENNPHFDFLDATRRGYGVLHAGKDELRVRFRAPKTTQRPRSAMSTIARFTVTSGHARVRRG
jgi:alkaline phosphatase D